MSRIRILPDEVANRIAAGEVIERPASVVKELVENALDAGASRILVRTRQGGRRLVQVVDDGCGMDEEDALLCIEAHATSKIRDARDIERVSTLGFRGEALPSISAVSRFRLQTRPHEVDVGTEIVVEAGAVRDVRQCGCPPGTSVRVENLFYNLPARRKFLRAPATENAHIHEVVLLHALAHTDVSFELMMEKQRVLFVSGRDDLGMRLIRLLGKEVAAAMLPVEYEEAGVRVRGFAATPGLTRASRREQRVFVNGRPAEADVVFYGIREAYHTLVMKGRYPPVVLFIELAPERVDVNVHPAKREVRFREGKLITGIVAAAVRRALQRAAAGMTTRAPTRHGTPVIPDAERGAVEAGTPAGPAGTVHAGEQQTLIPVRPSLVGVGAESSGADEATAADAESASDRSASESPEAVQSGTAPSAATRAEIARLRVIGRLHGVYLAAESEDGLVLIDQHAAHERVVYERLLAAARSSASASQSLLMPVTIHLTPADADLLRRCLDEFHRLGFGVEPFGGNSVLVTALPPDIPRENLTQFFHDLLDELRTGLSVSRRGAVDLERVAQAACKHAVRAEDYLSEDEVRELLRQLSQTEMPYTCPHGRPVMIRFARAEIEKRFGRRV